MSFLIPSHDNEQFRVYCVCGGVGFPFGTATTKRILLIGKCLAASGVPFHLCHIGPSSFEENKAGSGDYEGLTFEYLSPSVCRPDKTVKRALYYLWGCMLLPLRLFQHRRNILVYVYCLGDFINLWVLLLCRLMRLPVVQEACEWWPGKADCKPFTKWMYQNIMFRWSNGAVPISQEIQDRIRRLSGPDYQLCRMPVLVDPTENDARLKERLTVDRSSPVLFWCGMVDGYKRDVIFLIDAMSELKSPDGLNALLRIAGPCTENCRLELLYYARSKHISSERLDIMGFVSDTQLCTYSAQADALLMPLWPDDSSLTRFPTKLGQYLASGRPIVAAQVGEVKHFLSDETAMFYPPGDAKGLAHSLDRLLSDPALGERLASRATQEVLPRVDYRSNASRISKWFYQIYSKTRLARIQGK